MNDNKIDLERLEFFDLVKRIYIQAPESTKIKFLEGAMKYLALTEQEAFTYMKECISKNRKAKGKK